MLKKIATALTLVLIITLLSVTNTNSTIPAQASELQQAANLAAVKAYALDHAQQMKAATAALKTTAERYYILMEASDFDYETAFAQDGPLVAGLVQQAKDQWIEASTHYELDEGIVAGVPSLAFYDVWIDAGAPLADDPEGLEWTLELPDRTLDSPGNFFHNLLEPALYGTVDEYVGAEVDLDGDGTVELGEALPEANVFLGAAQGLDQATGEMLAAVENWEPTLEDTFGALVTMIPTMNEYFEQWKLSAFVSGEEYEETAFVGLSRLFDINGILNGLNVAYSNISPVVSSADADADAQIRTGFSDLVTYVGDLYDQELAGTRFSPEEADLFGTEAQDRATALAGQVAQAAALVDVEITEEDPVIPTDPIVVTAQVPDPLEVGLAAVKEYATGHAGQMKTATAELKATAERYYRIMEAAGFDYEAAFAESGPALTDLLAEAKEQWIEASTHYELDEGIVAGVPSLAFYDIWIDAGAPLADDPEGLEWTLELPDRTLDSPGNFFHNLLEPALYGTVDEYVGAEVDLDGDGTVELGEALPEANVFLGAAQGLDQATAEMAAAIDAWQPTPEDTFGALVTMIPTMNEYFEQWKLSAYVSGEEYEETAFVGLSRLFDINGILNGLNVAYSNISPIVRDADADADAQIRTGFSDLVTYVGDLYDQELAGTRFSPEEADLFGTEAQDRATALAGQVAQAAALVDVEITEEDPVIPTEPIVVTAQVPSSQLTVYSGRSESLVGPLIEQFEQSSGIQVDVRYGDTASMAATILEEGSNSPADLYYGQDAGALGALAKAGRLVELPADMLELVDPRFRSPDGLWIGASGRARTIIYNTDTLTEADLPDDIFGFCEPEWSGRLGWAPTNGSFQAFVTALRVVDGEDSAREWLNCIQANDPAVYSNNTAIVEAVGRGEIDAGFVNHYYLYQFLAEDPSFPAANYHLRSGDPGAMVNIAGAGILDSADNPDTAEAFIRYMLSEAGQTYFNEETHEYPLSADIDINPLLKPIGTIETPNIDLSQLDDLEGTLNLLQELGIL